VTEEFGIKVFQVKLNPSDNVLFLCQHFDVLAFGPKSHSDLLLSTELQWAFKACKIKPIQFFQLFTPAVLGQKPAQ